MRKYRTILAATLLLIYTHPTGAADKLRLGDIPDEKDKRADQRDRKEPDPEDNLSPEERRVVVEKLAEDYFKKGESAMSEGKLQQARNLFEKTLILSPSHDRAKQDLMLVKERMAPRPIRTRVVPVASPTPPSEVEIAKKAHAAAPRPAPKPSLSAEEAKDKSEELYLRALRASQTGKFEQAYSFCQEALKLDPTNLQARRMSERLATRVNHP